MRRPAAGFTLVEVLVAVLLLAVGLVGALAMQAHAMRTRHESALQTEALQAAATLADRIRANAAQSSAYLGFGFDGADGAQDGAASCTDTPCSAIALAEWELADFRQQLLAAAPTARAAICRDSAAETPAGQPQWPCSGAPGAPIVIKIGWRSRTSSGALGSPGPAITLPIAIAPAAPAPAPPPALGLTPGPAHQGGAP